MRKYHQDVWVMPQTTTEVQSLTKRVTEYIKYQVRQSVLEKYEESKIDASPRWIIA